VVESQQFEAAEIQHYCELEDLLCRFDQLCTWVENERANGVNVPPDIRTSVQGIREKMLTLLRGKRILNLFVQPSSRTQGSFEAAATMLGATVKSERDMSLSSMAKGETLSDTIRTFAQYYHAVILRTPWNYSTEQSIFAQQSIPQEIPIVNAGSGTRQHPTQALLDIATIRQGLGIEKLTELNDKTVTIVGDLLYGRTVKSLMYSLATVAPGVQIRLVSPPQLTIPDSFRQLLRRKNIAVKETTDLNSALDHTDVVYVTRVQREWFEKHQAMDQYRALKDQYLFTREHFRQLAPSAVVLHPLPRVNELSYTTDREPQSKIWEQVGHGMYMRAALLLSIFGRTEDFMEIIEPYDEQTIREQVTASRPIKQTA